MTNEKKPQRQGRQYVATESSLSFAETIARKMAMPFDKGETAELSDRLFEAMYDDLLRLLDLEDQGPRFESGSYSSTRLFLSETREKQPIIVLDMVFDFWVLATTHLTSIATFRVMSMPDAMRLTTHYDSLMSLFFSATRYEQVREEMAPYFLDYTDELRISSVLARATIVFALCHEISHAKLGHLDEDASPAIELAADAEALRLYARVCDQQAAARNTFIYVDPKVAGGPIIFMSILVLLEEWMLSRGLVSQLPPTHPPAVQRLNQMRELLYPSLGETAKSLVDAHQAALADIHDLLEVG